MSKRYSKKAKKNAKETARGEVKAVEKQKKIIETEDFYGHKVPKDKLPYLDRDGVKLIIKKGYVEGMKDDAVIFCNDDLLGLLCNEMLKDAETNFPSCVRQAANVATVPSVVKSLAMPDAHSGYGFSIGGVAAMRLDDPNAVICPGGVGFDINCGVRLIKTDLSKEDLEGNEDELADLLFKSIPSGVGTKSDIQLTKEQFDDVLKNGLASLVNEGYAWEEDLDHCEENGRLAVADPSLISKQAISRGFGQIGTLGSGNHYLEVQEVDEIVDAEAAKVMGITHKGQICVMIHCGSRGLGHQVCQDYIKDCMKEGIPNSNDAQLTGVLFNSELGQKYFSAMNCCANFAFANRGMITFKVRQAFKEVFKKSPQKLGMNLVYDVCHNIAKVEKELIDGKEVDCVVHRKGATRAFPPHHPLTPNDYKEIGQPAIIGGSMGTCSYVLVGTEQGRLISFSSTCHGAGRRLSRTKAMDEVSSKDVLERLKEKGIRVRITDQSLAAEESDEAYKDVTEVVQTCQDAGITKIVLKLKPLIVIKG